MGELEKILFIINRWGYLNTEQIAFVIKQKYSNNWNSKKEAIKFKNA